MAEVRKCGGCGAELTLGSTACPLCGTLPAAPRRASEDDPDEYRSTIRDLKRQLKKLRDEGAKAV
ncbi:MAG: hypothetical protein ACRDKB_13700 [Actinomycetota bacterium]